MTESADLVQLLAVNDAALTTRHDIELMLRFFLLIECDDFSVEHPVSKVASGECFIEVLVTAIIERFTTAPIYADSAVFLNRNRAVSVPLDFV